MVGANESMLIASVWASMAAWFTPTVIFCVTNLIIATIFIASNTTTTTKHQHNQHDAYSLSRIAGASSFLQRARSINLSSYTTTTAAAAELDHQYPSEGKSPSYGSFSRLAQSIHFATGDETQSESPNSHHRSSSEPGMEFSGQATRVSSLLERVKSIKFSSVYSDKTSPTESEQISISPGQLVRVPSFFDRVKSFKYSSPFVSGAPSTRPEQGNTDPSHNADLHVVRTKSDHIPVKKSLPEMKKSRSEMRITSDDEEEDVDRRRPETARVRRNADDEHVDAKADDFISRFKQQLQLQRLESLVRYNELLNRRN